MKKIFISTFALLLIISAVTMVACDDEIEPVAITKQTFEIITNSTESTKAETTSEKTTESGFTAPTGYTLYDDKNIVFAYPEDWTKTNGSATVIKEATSRNSINVVYEEKTLYYENMTTDSFIAEMKPLFASMGISTSDENVQQRVNEHGTKITVLTYSAVSNNVNMKQTQFIITSGNRTYTVTYSEIDPDDTVVTDVIFDTLVKSVS